MILTIHRCLNSLKIKQLTVSLITQPFLRPNINTFQGIFHGSSVNAGKFEGIEKFIGSSYDDLFHVYKSNSVIEGLDGNDSISLNNAVGARFFGGAGDDYLTAEGSTFFSDLGEGDDQIIASNSNAEIILGLGNDVVVLFNSKAKIFLGHGNNIILELGSFESDYSAVYESSSSDYIVKNMHSGYVEVYNPSSGSTDLLYDVGAIHFSDHVYDF